MMKKILLIILLALMVSCISCMHKKAKSSSSTTIKNELVRYVTVEKLFQQVDELSGKSVNVSGLIEHVCKHGGQRFKILSTNGSQELKIELGDLKIVSQYDVGKTANVTGILKPVKMNAEMVKAWEAKMKKNHAGEEGTDHYKEELVGIQTIHKQIESGEILFYTAYSLIATKYELE